jgi:hypothetical protein
VEDAHEPLVDRAIWNAMQNIMRKRAAKSPAGGRSSVATIQRIGGTADRPCLLRKLRRSALVSLYPTLLLPLQRAIVRQSLQRAVVWGQEHRDAGTASNWEALTSDRLA